MKKQIRPRNKNMAFATKPDNLTKAATQKHRQKKIIKKEMKKKRVQSFTRLEPTQFQTEQSTKIQCQAIEITTDIPQNLNIEAYLDDIDSHIISIDQKFHSSLEKHLKSAGNIEITSEMRKILIKWLNKISIKLCMQQESLHICVQLIDYMLIHKGAFFTKANLQLLGIASMFISCKYNQIYTLDAKKYIQLCDGVYTLNQLFEMESLILMEMNFNLQVPTLCQFTDKLIHSYKINTQQQSLIKALVNLSVFEFSILNSFKKHDLALTIVYFTTKLQNLPDLKQQLSLLKMKICPQIFKKCFISVMSLFKKHSQTTNISI